MQVVVEYLDDSDVEALVSLGSLRALQVGRGARDDTASNMDRDALQQSKEQAMRCFARVLDLHPGHAMASQALQFLSRTEL